MADTGTGINTERADLENCFVDFCSSGLETDLFSAYGLAVLFFGNDSRTYVGNISV